MSDTKIYSYDPKDLALIIGGKPVIASGEVVVSRNNDRTTTTVGITGRDKCINRNRDDGGTVTIPVMANSDIDAIFDAWSLEPDTVCPFILYHKSSNKTVVTECWYKQQADVSYGEEIALRGHVLELNDASLSPVSAVINTFDQFEKLLDALEAESGGGV